MIGASSSSLGLFQVIHSSWLWLFTLVNLVDFCEIVPTGFQAQPRDADSGPGVIVWEPHTLTATLAILRLTHPIYI